MTTTISLTNFVARWQASALTERSAAQSHFIDLCEVLGQSRPAAAGGWLQGRRACCA